MIRLNKKEDGKEILINQKLIILVENDNDDGSIIYSENYATTKVTQSLEQIEDMILRDQLAMSAMNGIISYSTVGTMTYCDLAKSAYSQADAMLKQRKEK